MTPYETLVVYREDYPAIMTPAQIGELLNRVAWDFRDEMRLLGKKSGNNCPMPDGTLISTDYLVHLPTKTGHDVLTGKDDGTTGTVRFTWGPGKEDHTSQLANGSRTLVVPIAPSQLQPEVPVVTPLPSTPPPAGFDFATAFEALRLQSDANTEKIQQQIHQAVENAEKSVQTALAQMGGFGGLLNLFRPRE